MTTSNQHPCSAPHIHAEFIAGMGKINGKFVIILNIQYVLSMDYIAALSAVGSASATELA